MPLDRLDADRAAVIDIAKTLGLETVDRALRSAESSAPPDAAGWKALGAKLARLAPAPRRPPGSSSPGTTTPSNTSTLADGSRPIDASARRRRRPWEADLGWVVRGGADIVAELTTFTGKVAAFHIKDMAPAGVTKDDGWTDVGAGTLDWQGLWPTIAGGGR